MGDYYKSILLLFFGFINKHEKEVIAATKSQKTLINSKIETKSIWSKNANAPSITARPKRSIRIPNPMFNPLSAGQPCLFVLIAFQKPNKTTICSIIIITIPVAALSGVAPAEVSLRTLGIVIIINTIDTSTRPAAAIKTFL